MASDETSAVPVPDGGPAPFRISVDPEHARLVVSGEFDREHAHHVLDALRALAGTGHRRWAIDTAQVVFCDAAGLRALVTAHHLARRHGCDLVVERPSPCLHRLVLLVGLDQVLDIRAVGAAAPPAAGGHRLQPSTGPLRAGHPVRTVPAGD